MIEFWALYWVVHHSSRQDSGWYITSHLRVECYLRNCWSSGTDHILCEPPACRSLTPVLRNSTRSYHCHHTGCCRAHPYRKRSSWTPHSTAGGIDRRTSCRAPSPLQYIPWQLQPACTQDLGFERMDGWRHSGWELFSSLGLGFPGSGAHNHKNTTPEASGGTTNIANQLQT